MGLDSVELLVESENFFQISIPDREAEDVLTVQDFGSCASKYVKFSSDEFDLKETIFNKIKLHLVQNFEILEDFINLSGNIEEVIAIENRKEIWESLQSHLGLEIPLLAKADLNINKLQDNSNNLTKSLRNFFSRKPLLKDRKISELVDWIISLNFRKLIKPNEIHNEYEIQRAFIGIITEKMGLEVYDIDLKHRIVQDLGIS